MLEPVALTRVLVLSVHAVTVLLELAHSLVHQIHVFLNLVRMEVMLMGSVLSWLVAPTAAHVLPALKKVMELARSQMRNVSHLLWVHSTLRGLIQICMLGAKPRKMAISVAKIVILAGIGKVVRL